MNRDDYFLKCDLKADRGWTDCLIKKFLGEPDKYQDNRSYHGGHPYCLFLKKRVLATESTSSFHDALQAAKRRSAIRRDVAIQQRSRLKNYVDALVIEVPCIEAKELLELACENYNFLQIARGRADFTSANEHSFDSQFLERIQVNYLRHALTRYEEELQNLAGKVGCADAALALKHKVLIAIGEKYPDLEIECGRQYRRAEERAGQRMGCWPLWRFQKSESSH